MGRYLPIVILLTFNVVIFLIQTIGTLSDYQNRSDVELRKFITKYIPKDKMVIGDATAGFVLLESGYNYLPIKSSLDLNEKLKKGLCDFAVIGVSFEAENGYTNSTLEYDKFKKTAYIRYEASTISRFLGDLGLITSDEKQLYSIQVYKKKI